VSAIATEPNGRRRAHRAAARPTCSGVDSVGDATRGRASTVDDRLCWSTIAGLAALHVGAAVGVVWMFVHWSPRTLALAMALYVACGLAITSGYHRLFAHRTYRASAPVRWSMLLFGAATFQNSAVSWSADHRAHHAHTDSESDPHAITSGIWFAHLAWLFRRRVASADVGRLGDLWSVRSIRLQHRWYAVLAIGVGLVLPAAVAWTWGDPWGGLFVAGFLRTVVMLQATFCINSLAHLVGTPRYDRGSTARDSPLTALVTFGEGYHSFHHRFPFDYRGTVHWWQYDPNKWLIWTLARVRLVNKVRTASPGTIERAETTSAEGGPRRASTRAAEDRRVEDAVGGVAGDVDESQMVAAGAQMRR
jgi:stearoyl-CoA desaturase (Delta-9 desaturase)